MLSNVGTILLATAWCTWGAAATSLTVPTTSGHVQGKWASGTNGVAEFLGIPYVSQGMRRSKKKKEAKKRTSADNEMRTDAYSWK